MSTKTTIKRIALVAAVAAAFGGLSTVAANAAVGTPALSGTVTLTSGTQVGVGSTTSAAVQVVGGIATVVLAETTTITAGSSAVPTIIGTLSSTGVGTISNVANSLSSTITAKTLGSTSVNPTYPASSVGIVSDGTSAEVATNTITVYSAVAGVQTLSFTPIGATGAPGTPVTFTITWGAAPVASASYSVVSIASGTLSTTLGTATSSTDPLSAPNTAHTAAGAQAATIGVEVESAATTLLAGQGLSVSVTGPGLLSAPVDEPSATAVALSSSAGAVALGRSVSLAASGSHGYAAIALFGDGTSGTSTVTVSTAAGVVLGTVSFTFTGSAAKVSATQNLKVLKAGGVAGSNTVGAVYNGQYSSHSSTTVLDESLATALTSSNLDGNTAFTVGESPITATTTDALGNPVALASAGLISSSVIKVVVSDPTILTAGSCYAVAASTTASGTATNEINCAVTGTTGATSGASATATVELYDTNTAAWDILAAPLTFTIGGSVVAETAALDAATYAPGQPLALSIKATDKAGNAAYDQDINGLTTAVPSTYIQGFATPTELIGGVATKTVAGYAPVQDGTFTITGVDGDSGVSEALSVTASVTTGAATASNAATDAANEATDAANAATDAANAAADAADAATSAAQDAGAKADAALAAVTALSAKITVLAAQIAKIVKKLKA